MQKHRGVSIINNLAILRSACTIRTSSKLPTSIGKQKLYHINIAHLKLPNGDNFNNKFSFKHLESPNRFVKQSYTIDMPVVNAPNSTLEILDLDNFDSETATLLNNCLFVNDSYEAAFPTCTIKPHSLIPMMEDGIVCEINFALWGLHADKLLSMQASYGKEKIAQSIRLVINRHKYINWLVRTLPILKEKRETIKAQATGIDTQNIDNIITTMEEQLVEYNACKESESKEQNSTEYETIFFSVKDEPLLKKIIKQQWKAQKESIDKDFTSNNLVLSTTSHDIIINSDRDDIWAKINEVFIIEEFDGQGHVSKYFEQDNNISKKEIEEIRASISPIMEPYNTKLLREISCIDLLDLFHGVLYCQARDRKIKFNTPEEKDSARQLYWWAQHISTSNMKVPSK